MSTITTERLVLRPLRIADAEAWHAIWGDPDVIWWGAAADRTESRAGLERVLARMAACPDGMDWYAVTLREDADRADPGAVLGDVLFQPAPFVDGIEIGWHFRRSAWGHGYATEAARAVADFAFARGLVERLYAIVALQNAPSLRVVEKLGMQVVKDMTYADLPHRLFALDRPGG